MTAGVFFLFGFAAVAGVSYIRHEPRSVSNFGVGVMWIVLAAAALTIGILRLE